MGRRARHDAALPTGASPDIHFSTCGNRQKAVLQNSKGQMQVPHNRITSGSAEVEAVYSVVKSGQWVGGPRQSIMEERLRALFGAAGVAGVGSGLAALRLALRAAGVAPGDEVLVPAYSCVAVANSVLALDASPVPVDVCEGSWNVDNVAARRKITRRTKAAIVVNTFGLPADITGLANSQVSIIEDCSHGFACTNETFRPLRGDFAVFSFYATKLIRRGRGRRGPRSGRC